MTNFEPSVIAIMKLVRSVKTSMKDSTAKTYTRMLRRLFDHLSDKGKDMTLEKDIMPKCLLNVEDMLKDIEETYKKDNTKKNQLSFMLTLMRCYIGDDYEKDDLYKGYRKAFDIIKASNHSKQEQQEPTGDEIHLKGVDMDQCERALSHHFNKVRGAKSKNIKSAMLNMLGHLHCDQVLRNEAHNMMLSKHYLQEEHYPNTNFIWVKGRNVKMMVIRNNKVRNPELDGYKPKEEILRGKVNTAINKYIQVLTNVYGEYGNIVPLVHSKNWSAETCSLDCYCISSSTYSQLFKDIWAHKFENFSLTTTLLRKVYAMDVRDKYKGNLVKEKIALNKLDHSAETHNLHYIVNFD